jgi:ubiquinone/menaquinone biosynthesis C-methylase UbiE
MAPRFVAKQLSHPAGLGGWLIRNLMNRGNARLNAFALEQLALISGDRVLEVGFGGGVALKSLLQNADHVCGIDRSEDAVEAARKRFGREVGEGRAEFRIGAVEALPFAGASLDKALSVNTVYFWTSLDGGLAEIARVLKNDGRIALGFLPKERMERMNFPPDIFTPREPEDLTAAMAGAGFTEVKLHQPRPDPGWMVATGVRV